MTLRERWMRLLYGAESHSIDKRKLWGTDQEIGDPVHAGVLVSQESALRLAVVWRCIQLISGTLASLPWEAIRHVDNIRRPVDRPASWLEVPNPDTTIFEFKERVCESLLMDGNAFVLIASRDALGFPTELWTLHPRSIEVKTQGSRTVFLWNGTQELSKFGPTSPTGDVLHVKLATAGGNRGMSPIEAARQAIGLGLVTEKTGARFFGSGMVSRIGIQLPADQPARTQEHIDLMRLDLEKAHAGSDKSFRPIIATGGGTLFQLTIPPEDAQFLETRKFQVEDIAARIYGVPAHLVGLEEKNTSWGTGIEAQTRGFHTFTLKPHIARLEAAFSQLLPRGQFVNVNHKAFLSTDAKTEAEILAIENEHGVTDPNEWRAILDKPPKRTQPPAPIAPANPNGNGQQPVEVTE